MDAALLAALEDKAPVEVLLTTIEIDDETTIRWTDGGFVMWGDDLYTARDPAWGVLSSISEIEDGIDGQATNCTITILPPDSAALMAWIAPEVQGATITVHMGAVDRATGLLIGEPDLLLRAELDEPKLNGPDGGLIYELITEEARMLESNDERRLTDPFNRSVWPDDDGLDKVSALPRKKYWRASDPNNAIR